MKCSVKYRIEGCTEEEFRRLETTRVFASEDSPTGYVASFRYKAPEQEKMWVIGDWMFSDIFHSSCWESGRYWPHQWRKEYFPHTLLGLKQTPGELKKGAAIDPSAFDWEILKLGMYEMEKEGDTDIFSCTIPLPSGTFNYRFVLDLPEGNPLKMRTVPDPAHCDFALAQTGIRQKYSQVKAPFCPKRQVKNRESELGCKREPGCGAGRKGQVHYVNYETDESFGAGKWQTAGIYLPYGYDAERPKPYPVLYLSHGGGGDAGDWMTQGAAPELMDSMIFHRLSEPMVVVTMDNQVFQWESGVKCIPNLTRWLMPFVEAHYHVSRKAEGRSFAGLSAGGCLAFDLYESVGYLFGHIGIWSGGRRFEADYNKEFLKDVEVHVGGGRYDDGYLTFGVALENELARHKLPFTSYTPLGGHQWSVWRELLEDFVTRVLSQNPRNLEIGL